MLDVSQLHDAVVAVDLQGTIIGWNQGAERLYGFSADEAIGKPIVFLAPVEDRGASSIRVAEILAGKLVEADVRARTRDGRTLTVRVSYSVLRDRSGPFGIVGYGVDVTAKRALEDERAGHARSVELLAHVAVTANEAVCSADAIAATLAALTSFTKWEVGHAYLRRGGTMSCCGIWTPTDADRFSELRAITERARTASANGLPEWIRAGSPYFWDEQFAPTPRSAALSRCGLTQGAAFPVRVGAETVGILEFLASAGARPGASMRELMALIGEQLGRVIERERIATALLRRETHFRLIFETAAVGFIELDARGRCRDANTALSRLLGHARTELLTMSFADLAHPDDHDSIHRALAVCRTMSVPIECRLVTREQATLSCLLSASALPAVDGEPHYMLAIHDLTARREAERAVRELSTRMLHVQDEERRKIARTLHDSSAQDLAAVAVNLTMLAKHATVDETGRRALDESVDLVARCSREIRTLSHLLHPPLLEEAGLSAALRWYIEGFAARSSIAVTLDLDGQLERLPRELETTLFRIVQEGLTNIMRHSGSQTAAIRLGVDAETIVLEIADEGCGFPPHMVDGKGDASVGVGIAGMRARIRQFAGELALGSEARGARIRVTVPLEDGG